MPSNQLIFDIIYIVLRLVQDAMMGNKVAQKKLKDILPPKLQTQVVKEAQDKLDEEKFGPREEG